MLDEINLKLIELKEAVRLKNKIKSSLENISSLLDTEIRKNNILKIQVEKEYSDVENLEGLSLTGIFHAVLGDKEEKYQKEKREYLAAKLKFDNSLNTITLLKEEKKKLEEEVKKSGNPEKEYERLIAEKEKIILNLDNGNSQQLNGIYEKIGDSKREQNEIDEALQAGTSLILNLEQVVGALKSAKGWGTWDLLGGGIIATAIKHGKIDQARSLLAVTQMGLSRFSKELRDVGFYGNLSIEIGGFETFADYFLDNIITDWMVQSKINKSLDQANQVYFRVQSICFDLKKRKDGLENYMASLETGKNNLVEST